MIQIQLTRRFREIIPPLAAALIIGCTPLYLSDTHTTSTPRSQSFNVAELAHEPVATLGLVTPAGLQGFNPPLSHALNAALSETSPPIRGIAAHETVNVLNQQGLAAEYGALIAGFGRGGILESEPLQRIGSALSSRYVLLPGLAEFNQVIIDRLSIYGWNFIQSRVTTSGCGCSSGTHRRGRFFGSQLGKSPWRPSYLLRSRPSLLTRSRGSCGCA